MKSSSAIKYDDGYVTKFTRASKQGKEIVCTGCYTKHRVYHFAWTALQCMDCGYNCDKYDWMIALTDKEKYTGKTDTWGNGIVVKEVNTKMIQDTVCDINTSDYPDFADSHFESATWIDGSELTDEELEHLDSTDGFLYECIERQLY